MERERLVALVSRAQNGDGDALNDLFGAFYQDVYYFALKTVKDEQTAADVTQETFIEIIQTIGNLKEPAAFVSWMKQITYHQCTRYFKKKKDVIVDEDEDGNTLFDDIVEEKTEFIPDEALEKDEFKKTVLALLDELSEEQRAAVMMFYFEEMSIREIAAVQEVNENTVKSRLNYARKAMKNLVEDYESKTGVKLRCNGVLPILLFVFKDAFTGAVPAAVTTSVASGVSAATGIAVTATAGTAAGAGAAATVTAAATATASTVTAATATAAVATGIGAKIAAIPLVGKVIACVVAGTLAVGGGTAAVILSQNDDDSAYVEEAEGIIPEGMVYTTHDGTVLKAGDRFPESCTRGDKVAYGDYRYGYECVYTHNLASPEEYHEWVTVEYFVRKDGSIPADSGVTQEDITGCWLPMVSDQNKTVYGEIEEEINGKPIGALWMTFYGCKKMTVAPAIPDGVTSISTAYYDCAALKKAPVIPRSVKRLASAFRGCVALNGDVVYHGEMDKSIFWYYYGVFSGCVGHINLTGSASEEDLLLIASKTYLGEGGVLTVNGKVAVTENDRLEEEEEAFVYFTLDRLYDSPLTLHDVALRALQNAEHVGGFGGGADEVGAPVNAIYATDFEASCFADMDIFGYGLTMDELLGIGWGGVNFYSWLIPEPDKSVWESENTETVLSSVSVHFSLPLENKEDIRTLVVRDMKIFTEKLDGLGDPYVRIGADEHPYHRGLETVTREVMNNLADLKPDSSIQIFTSEKLDVNGEKFSINLSLSALESDGVYYYSVSLYYSFETGLDLY